MRDANRLSAGVPTALLDVIARAIRLHVHGLLTPFAARVEARLDAQEANGRETRERVDKLNRQPKPDHAQTLNRLDETQREQMRQIAASQRELDRARQAAKGVRERIDKLEAASREATGTINRESMRDRTASIERLRRAVDESAQQASFDRKDLAQAQVTINTLGERLAVLEATANDALEQVRRAPEYKHEREQDRDKAMDRIEAFQEEATRQRMEDREALHRKLDGELGELRHALELLRERFQTIEALKRDPVLNVTSFPVKDHTDTIESLRRVQEQSASQTMEMRRDLDRALDGANALHERLAELETSTRACAASVDDLPVKEHAKAIEGLRHQQNESEEKSAEREAAMRRELNDSIDSIAALRDRFTTLESNVQECVANVNGLPFSQHAEAIDDLRRTQEASDRQASDSRRESDRSLSRLQGDVAALGERFNTVDATVDAAVDAAVEQASRGILAGPIDDLRRTQEASDRQASDARRESDRSVSRLQGDVDALGERFNTFDATVDAAVEKASRDILSGPIEEWRQARSDDRLAIETTRQSVEALRERLVALEASKTPTPNDGRDGRDGQDGRDGKDGQKGQDGQDGRDGRDAYDIDVLPHIDFARSYVRGTLAQHDGGLWRAHTNTDGTHGWDCIVDGIRAVKIEQDADRVFSIHVKRASGATDQTAFDVPVMIYRGVYRTDVTYRPGDAVTWAGSLWHCDTETDAKPDSGDEAWTLAVRRGRDGKNGKEALAGAGKE